MVAYKQVIVVMFLIGTIGAVVCSLKIKIEILLWSTIVGSAGISS